MTIYPIEVSQVTQAIEQRLKADEELVLLGTTVLRSEPVNEQPSACPWIGIYRFGVRYPSRTLGVGSGYRQQRIGLALIVQQTHPESGEQCELELEKLIQHVLRVLLSDESLKGTVDVLDEFEVDYQNYGLVASAYMQTAVIQFVGVVNVRGG